MGPSITTITTMIVVKVAVEEVADIIVMAGKVVDTNPTYVVVSLGTTVALAIASEELP
jgi:hypothetical protein